MKKELIAVSLLLIAFVLVFAVLVHADEQAAQGAGQTAGQTAGQEAGQTAAQGELGEKEIQQIGEEWKKRAPGLQQDIILPQVVKDVAKILFKTDIDLDLSGLVIYVCVFLGLAIILFCLFRVFLGGWKTWVLSLLLTGLLSYVGTVNSLASSFFALGKIVSFFEGKNYLISIILFLIVIIILFASIALSDWLKGKFEPQKAKMMGMRMTSSAKSSEMMSKAFSSR